MPAHPSSESLQSLRDHALEEVRAYLLEQRQIEPERVQESTDFRKDLGLDSLDLAAIAMQFEDEYDVTLDDERVLTVKTVGDAINLVIELRGGQALS
jgi:acyl carrier protein